MFDDDAPFDDAAPAGALALVPLVVAVRLTVLTPDVEEEVGALDAALFAGEAGLAAWLDACSVLAVFPAFVAGGSILAAIALLAALVVALDEPAGLVSGGAAAPLAFGVDAPALFWASSA